MKITFLGGADEVGASSTLLEIGGKHILVDCGIRPSPRARGGLAGDQLPHLDTIKNWMPFWSHTPTLTTLARSSSW